MRITPKIIRRFSLLFKNRKGGTLVSCFIFAACSMLYGTLYLDQDTITSWTRVTFSINIVVELTLLALIAVSLALIFYQHKLNLRSLLSRQIIFVLLLVTFGALLLRFQMPIRHYIFYDEDFSLHYAQMINETGRPIECDFGIYQDGQFDCISDNISEIQIKKGYPLLLAIVFRALGNSELAAFSLNILLGVLTVLLTFFIGRELWSIGAGLFSAALVAVLPAHVWLSATTSIEVPSLFFLLSGLLAFLLFVRIKKYTILILSFLLIAYATFIRPEMILVFPYLVAFLLINKEFRELAWRTWIHTAATLLVSFFLVFQIVMAIMSRSAYTVGAAEIIQGVPLFSVDYFRNNIAIIALNHFLIRDYIIAILIGAAIWGSYQLARRSWKLAAIFVGIPLTFFFVYTSYFAGSTGVHALRFAVSWMVPLAIIAGIGLDIMGGKISGWFAYRELPRKIRLILPLFMFVALALYIQIHFTNFMPVNFYPTRIMELHAKEIFQGKNPTCLYVDDVAIRDLFRGYNAISYAKISTTSAEEKDIIDRAPCVVFFEVEECRDDLRKVCDSILSTYYWEKLPYEDINTWLRSGTSKGIHIPEPAVLSFRPKSLFMTIANKFGRIINR